MCHSWLLYSEHMRMLPENSNIRKDKIKFVFSKIWNGGKGVKELYNLLLGTYSETSDEEIYCSLSAQTIDTKDGINAGLEFFSSINDIIGEYGKKDL